MLAHHHGHGPVERIVPDAGQFASLLEALIDGGRATEVTGIISGYLASPEQAHAVATLSKPSRRLALRRFISAIRSSVTLFRCGGGGLYVAEPLAAAIRDELLPLADLATPTLSNAPGSRMLAMPSPTSLRSPARFAAGDPRHLGGGLMRGHIGSLLVTGRDALLFEHPRPATSAKGTGDLLAAFLLARRLMGQSLSKAVETALSSVFEIVAGTAKAGGTS